MFSQPRSVQPGLGANMKECFALQEKPASALINARVKIVEHAVSNEICDNVRACAIHKRRERKIGQRMGNTEFATEVRVRKLLKQLSRVVPKVHWEESLALPETFELASEATQEFTTTKAVDVTEPPLSVRFDSTITCVVPGLVVDVAVACQGPETSAFCGVGGVPLLLLEPPPQSLDAHNDTHSVRDRAGNAFIFPPLREVLTVSPSSLLLQRKFQRDSAASSTQPSSPVPLRIE